MGQYIRHAVATIEEVVGHIEVFWGAKQEKVLLENSHKVGVTSLRLKTFCRANKERNGIYCSACGIKASFFAVESFTGSQLESRHVNLYGYNDDGQEVLFTRDHIVPRSSGGADNLGNSQVMCQPCNSSKGSQDDKKFKAGKHRK